ncbi:MAG TPA: hypothetical protein VF245_00165 [Solirubrobacterales bacterium]
MSKRYVVLGLSLVLALALAVPALGGPSNLIASASKSVKKTAETALKTAKQAKKQANTANKTANEALEAAKNSQTSADGAAASAKKAQESADKAQTTANGAKTTADQAKTLAEKAEANANTKVRGVYYQFGSSSAEDTETTKNVSAFCEGEDESTGGGWAFNGSTNVTVTASTPTFYGDGWFVTAKAISGTPTWSIQANTVCTEK